MSHVNALTTSQIMKVVARENLMPGDTRRVNHMGCSAGEDTKHRLWITVEEDGVRGYCHHCSGSWGAKVGNDLNKSTVSARLGRIKGNTLSSDKQEVALPVDYTASVAAMPLEAKAILTDGNVFTGRDTVGYSPRARRIVIAVKDVQCKKTVFIQYKKVFANDDGPKYYNVSGIKKADVCVMYYAGRQVQPTTSITTVVITEDVFSATWGSRTVSSHCGFMPVFGVSLSDTQLEYLITHFPNVERVILALDNDNPTVQWKTTQMFLKLRRTYEVSNLLLKKDLKAMSRDAVQDLILVKALGLNKGDT